MKIQIRLIPVVFLLLLQVGSCNDPGDVTANNSSDKNKQYVSVSINIRSQQKAYKKLSNTSYSDLTGLPDETKTALILAVKSGTTFKEKYNDITGWYDKQLVDLASSSVSLKLPLDTKLELFEYTFNEKYILSSLNTADRFVFSCAKLGPFTITGSANLLRLTADLHQALAFSFDELIDMGSFNIEKREKDGYMAFIFEEMNWKNLEGQRYVFDPGSRKFAQDTSNESDGYTLVGTEWKPAASGAPDSTWNRTDYDTFTVYYVNPDFSASLVGIIDLARQGYPVEMDDKSIMGQVSYNTGARAYIIEVKGFPSDEYRLEEIENSHECNPVQFNSLGSFIDYGTQSPFTCQDYDGNTCLTFDNYSSGKTSGKIIEEIRDPETDDLISKKEAGTWQIKTVSTKQLLFFYPDDSGYYHESEDGNWASFWTVFEGKVWRGNYRAEAADGSEDDSMIFLTYNKTALSDLTMFLKSAPDAIFISQYSDGGESDDGDGSCTDDSTGSSESQLWGKAVWGQFKWAP